MRWSASAHGLRANRLWRSGFSLVELLIVIAIILILISLLIPAARTALEITYQLQCANNLRQLITVAVAYAAVHDGDLPWVWDGWDGPNQDNGWGGWLMADVWKGPNNTWTGDITTGQLYQYARNESIYWCPLDTGERGWTPGNPWGYENAAMYPPVTSYVFNTGRWSCSTPEWGGTDHRGLNLADYKPGMFLMFEEDPINGVCNDGYVFWWFFSPWGYQPLGEDLAQTHRGGGNIGFPDGHVEWMDYWDYYDEDNGWQNAWRLYFGYGPVLAE